MFRIICSLVLIYSVDITYRSCSMVIDQNLLERNAKRQSTTAWCFEIITIKAGEGNLSRKLYKLNVHYLVVFIRYIFIF